MYFVAEPVLAELVSESIFPIYDKVVHLHYRSEYRCCKRILALFSEYQIAFRIHFFSRNSTIVRQNYCNLL
nr:MAG TPA: hypothetical protein [Caudoviricetes sp.]